MLAGLLAVVALVALWLSDCIPGFGVGAGTKDSEGEAAKQDAKPEVQTEAPKPVEQPPAKVEPEVAAPKPTPMKVTVDARGCMVNGADPIDCETVCDQAELFDNVDTVLIDATDGPQGFVDEVLTCVEAKHLAVKITRE